MYSASTPRLHLPRANEIDDNNRLAGPAFCIYPLFKPVYHFGLKTERERERTCAGVISIAAHHQILQCHCCNVNDRSAWLNFSLLPRRLRDDEKIAQPRRRPRFRRRKENRASGFYESGESSSGSRGRDSHRRMEARQNVRKNKGKRKRRRDTVESFASMRSAGGFFPFRPTGRIIRVPWRGTQVPRESCV